MRPVHRIKTSSFELLPFVRFHSNFFFFFHDLLPFYLFLNKYLIATYFDTADANNCELVGENYFDGSE